MSSARCTPRRNVNDSGFLPTAGGPSDARSPAAVWVHEHADEIVGFLRDLIRCPHPGGAGAQGAPDRIAGELDRLGLEVSRLTPDLDRLTGHPGFRNTGVAYDDRPVVLGRATGRGGGRSLILNGHVDVVAAPAPERWTHPPFAAELADGRVVGRGAADAKGPLVALVYGLACAREIAGGLAGDITVMAVADEELGGMGTLAALEAGVTADGAIVGEPTGLAVAPASRGAASFRLDVEGQHAHSGSAFLGVNAILKTTAYIEALCELATELDRERPHPLYADLPVAHCFNVATIEGGEWAGVVPAHCSVEIVAGGIAGETAAELQRWVEERIEAVTAADPWLSERPPRLEWTALRFDPGSTPLDHPLVATVLAAGEATLGSPPPLLPLFGGSDLRFFTNWFGMPAVHLGPGEMLAGHGDDESIRIDELLLGVQIAAGAIARWSGSSAAAR